MGFFVSPVKLINLLKKKDEINKSQPKPEAWYTSEEGKQAYAEAKSTTQKSRFFFDYLCAIPVGKGKATRPLTYKLAFIIADSMVGSKLEFGGYPNVLDASKNPLVAYYKQGFSMNEGNALAADLLCALHGQTDPKDYLRPERKPYLHLTQRNADGTCSDLYKIERDIIWAFCTKTDDALKTGPFNYDIVKNNVGDKEG